MGDKKPKKKSSGTNEAHKAREAKAQANKLPGVESPGKDKGKKK